MSENLNIYETWDRHHCTNIIDINMMHTQFMKDKPTVGGFDTETDGLHLKRSKPFLQVFGWLIPGHDQGGRVYTFEFKPAYISTFMKMVKELNHNVAHNVKYDCHMMRNGGFEYTYNNLFENMALARLVFEAVPARNGGESLALKSIARKYVHPDADQSEQDIKIIKKRLQAERVKSLAACLKQFTIEGEFDKKGKPKRWTKGRVEDFLKDITHDVTDLPSDVQEVYKEWLSQFPYGDYEPTYKDIYEAEPEKMIRYAGDDVISMLEFYRKAMPVCEELGQVKTLELENRAILPFYRMESVGLRLDMEYLEESRLKVKQIITNKRDRLCELAGETVTVGQHARIKQLFKERWDIDMDSADDGALKKVRGHEEAEEFAKIIRSLRTLEKWYSTYILALIDNGSYDGRAYTQISQCSAVSGRVGSNFQQFPKKGIKDDEGNELFHARRAFIPTDQGKEDGYNSIWYLDLSQVELRVQANYTILVSGGDENLCRAYMPFRCVHWETGEEYDFRTDSGRARWNELKEGFDWSFVIPEEGHKPTLGDALNQGWSAWHLPDTWEPWTPTDVHSQTTKTAYPDLIEGTPEFKEMRSKGKMVNFMCNYGGGMAAALGSLDMDDEQEKYKMATKLLNGYNNAFPKVKTYQEKITVAHNLKGYVHNMCGRRYYLENNNDSYKLANYCVQGSCADDLKRAIIEADELLLDKKTRFILPVHDELQFEVWKGEEYLIPKLLEIMENVEWSLVPILADVEVTYTNWRDKKEVDKEELVYV